jgi:hypothetical protein
MCRALDLSQGSSRRASHRTTPVHRHWPRSQGPVFGLRTLREHTCGTQNLRLDTKGAYLHLDKISSVLFLGRFWKWREMGLLADAELAEDEVEDVVGGGGAREGVEGVEGFVEIEKDHLVGDRYGDALLRPLQRG